MMSACIDKLIVHLSETSESVDLDVECISLRIGSECLRVRMQESVSTECLSCASDVLQLKLSSNISPSTLFPDVIPVRIGYDCLSVKIKEDVLSVNITEVINLGSGLPNRLVSSVLAGENIGSLRILTILSDGAAFHADYRKEDHASRVFGISMSSGVLGGRISVVTHGVLTDPAFSFTDGPVYVGPNGVLIQVPPVDGYVLQVGNALSAQSVDVDIKVPIMVTS
jgi:hypothetical protein